MIRAIQELKEENDELKAELNQIRIVKEEILELANLNIELYEQIRILKINSEKNIKDLNRTGNEVGLE
jgi:hypothetical protein